MDNDFFKMLEFPSGYKFVSAIKFFASEYIFLGILNGDSLDESLMTFFFPSIDEAPGMYLAISFIVGLTSFEIVFFFILSHNIK